MKLSANFSLDELTYSETAMRRGIDNAPDEYVLKNLRMLAEGLERVRTILGHPLRISSGYRCPTLNTAIGGSRSSAHMSGLAADFTCPEFGSPYDICVALEQELAYIGAVDQLILEGVTRGNLGGSWVHIGFSDTPRYELLSAVFDSGRVIYRKGIGSHAT